MQELDKRLAALGRTEIDHNLNALERAVWAKVDANAGRLRPMPTRMAATLCAVVAILAAGTGAAAAAAIAQTAPDATAFPIRAPLALSTILGD